MVVAGPRPAAADVAGARMWLARRGVAVDEPTPLLALRIGVRVRATRSYLGFSLLSVVVWIVAVFPPVPVVARFLVFSVVCAAFPLTRWRRVRRHDRAAARLVPAGAKPSWRVAAGQVGWWYLAAAGLTFAGGAVLCAGFAAGPVAAAGWAAALAIGAASTALVLGHVLRAPVIAEDEASRAVDAALRAHDAAVFALPYPFAFLAWIDLATTWPWPPARIAAPVAYLVLVLAASIGAAIALRRRRLPPGRYGTVTP
ncbi:hypothetical protein Q5425_21075 [Amycolatopsis sp. A133]|uniref:hypothetical protein n=1 Tax=Amycolatopsis sp. A133 TaxID=3064472 RepID=UPI0027F771E8|nr:hypothetical protein [Amycolatopsis sp. A133]MDQ7806244.1 hypothetical protein [Amycolatopsis sp. A133]